MRFLFIVCFFSIILTAPLSAQEAENVAQGAIVDSVELDAIAESIAPMEEVPAENEAIDATQADETVPAEPQSELLKPSSAEQAELLEADVEVKQLVPHSGLYFDADAVVPDSVLGVNAGPREVDPKYEPGSRFVVVKKEAGSKTLKAQMVAAERALKLGRYSSALELYEQLYRKNPRSHTVLMGLAIAQQQNGFSESAIATYEELLKHEPKNTEAMVNMLGLIQKQYPAVAYRKLKNLWQKDGRNPAIAAQLGLTSAQSGNTQEALQYLGVAASLEPQNALHYYNMAVVADRAGVSKEALTWYEKALEVDVTFGNSRSIPRDQVYDRLAHLRRL